jgi:hypothetical protein
MYLEDIETLLSGMESNIYISSMADVDTCIGIFATGGKIPTADLSGNLLYREPFFQIIIRDTSFSSGWSRSEAILLYLTGKLHTVSTIKYSFKAKSDILDLGKDEKQRSQFSINFEVMM